MKMNKLLLGSILIASMTTAALSQTSTNDIRRFGGQRVKSEEINWSGGERPLIVEEPTICTMDLGKLGMVNVRLERGDRVLGYLKRSDEQYDYYTTSRFGDCGNKTIGEIRIKRKMGTTAARTEAQHQRMLAPPPPPGDVNVNLDFDLNIPINVTTNNYGGATGERPQRPLPGATMIAGVRGEGGLQSISYAAPSKTNIKQTQIGGGATATGGNATATGGNASASSTASSTATATAAAEAKAKSKGGN